MWRIGVILVKGWELDSRVECVAWAVRLRSVWEGSRAKTLYVQCDGRVFTRCVRNVVARRFKGCGGVSMDFEQLLEKPILFDCARASLSRRRRRRRRRLFQPLCHCWDRRDADG